MSRRPTDEPSPQANCGCPRVVINSRLLRVFAPLRSPNVFWHDVRHRPGTGNRPRTRPMPGSLPSLHGTRGQWSQRRPRPGEELCARLPELVTTEPTVPMPGVHPCFTRLRSRCVYLPPRTHPQDRPSESENDDCYVERSESDAHDEVLLCRLPILQRRWDVSPQVPERRSMVCREHCNRFATRSFKSLCCAGSAGGCLC